MPSVYVFLLPYVEQQPLYDVISSPQTINGVNYPAWTGGSARWDLYWPWTARISMYRCPSDGMRQETVATATTPTGEQAGWCNYGPCVGDGIFQHGYGTYPGVRGMFNLSTYVAPSDVWDGLSRTIAFSELLINDGTRDIRRATAPLTASGVLQSNPSSCFATVAPDGKTYLASITGLQTAVGTNWYDWRRLRFTTIFPPNAPSCCYGCWGGRGTGVIPPASEHPGGVNAVMADGAVQFISNTIDCGDLASPEYLWRLRTAPAQYPGYAGDSPYGVWGAMGSINGGESTSLQN